MNIGRFEQLLDIFTAQELSAALACPYQTAAAMKRRGSVGTKHWPRLIDAARARGVALDGDKLIKLAAQRSADAAP